MSEQVFDKRLSSKKSLLDFSCCVAFSFVRSFVLFDVWLNKCSLFYVVGRYFIIVINQFSLQFLNTSYLLLLLAISLLFLLYNHYRKSLYIFDLIDFQLSVCITILMVVILFIIIFMFTMIRCLTFQKLWCRNDQYLIHS